MDFRLSVILFVRYECCGQRDIRKASSRKLHKDMFVVVVLFDPLSLLVFAAQALYDVAHPATRTKAFEPHNAIVN